MPQLRWTPEALADVQRLYLFLADKDGNAAKRAIREILRSIKILALLPQAGRPIDKLPLQFREWPNAYGNSGYLVLYHFNGTTAVIVAVRHQFEAGY